MRVVGRRITNTLAACDIAVNWLDEEGKRRKGVGKRS